MTLRAIPIFPVEICAFQNPDTAFHTELIEELSKEDKPNVSSFDDNKVWQTSDRLHRDEKYQKLINWFRQCLEEYKAHYGFRCEQFDITSCWANVAGKDAAGQHQMHYHPMSYVSGCYYVTEGSPTIFKDPITQRLLNAMRLDGIPAKTPDTFGMIPDVGKLILFPSWLEHGTIPHVNQPNDRWTISFNAIPVGMCNFPDPVREPGNYGYNTWNIRLAD